MLQDVLAPSGPPPPSGRRKKATKCPDPEEYLAGRVSAKIEEGDFRGAIRLASSDDSLADASDETYTALCAKHPAPHPDSKIPPGPSVCVSDESDVTCAEVFHAIRSFPCGSAGGPDMLRPQHLKDLIQHVGLTLGICACTGDGGGDGDAGDVDSVAGGEPEPGDVGTAAGGLGSLPDPGHLAVTGPWVLSRPVEVVEKDLGHTAHVRDAIFLF